MLRQTAAVAVVFIIAMMATTTSALFEDQVGKFDWFRPGVGHASLAAFYPPSATLKTVYVATWKSVVASFGIGKGDMRWRRVFGSNDTIRCLEVNEKSVFVALSPSNVLYSLDPKNGDVRRVWPLAHTPIGCGMQESTLTLIAAGPHVATIAESAVKTLETVQFTALEGASTSTSAAASGAVTADGAIAVLFEDGSLNQWATPTTKQPTVSANANEAPAGSRLRANVACPAQLFVGACKAAFSVQKDLSISTIADTTTLPLSCDAATGPKLVVSPTGFVTLNDKTTGLRERAGTRLKLVGMRQVDATRIDAVVSSSSGAFQFLKLKVTGSNDVTVQSSWIVEGGLSEVGFGVFPEMRHRLDEPTSSRVHQFGLNDRIVVASRSGMLFSLLSNDSRDDAEWQAFPAGDASIHFPQVRGKCFRVLSLKSVSDLIIVRLRFFDSAQTIVQLTYSVFTGELVSQASDVAAKANVFLPDGATVSADGVVSGEALTQQRDFYKINRTSGEINGFTIPANSLQAVPSWTLSLGAPLVAHAVASSNLGAVTSPESMRYIPNATVAANEIKRKYPTANVLVACHYQTDDEGVKILIVSAFDTISGQVLGRMRHKEVDGAVHAIVVDNVIIYHFTSTSSMRSFVGVWELFEHQEGQLLDSQITSPALIGMSFFEKRRTVSGLTARPPQIQAQILNFLQGSIQGLTVTASLLNIARKNIIFATTTGHILSVPLMELRIGYVPPTVAGAPPPPPKTIIVPSTSVVSHKHIVMRGEFILAGPTPLESTSHVLVAGLDLFYTRVSSGKPFDVIDDEFNYQGLVLICAGLTVATLGVRFWALRSKLHSEWA